MLAGKKSDLSRRTTCKERRKSPDDEGREAKQQNFPPSTWCTWKGINSHYNASLKEAMAWPEALTMITRVELVSIRTTMKGGAFPPSCGGCFLLSKGVS